MQRAQLLADQNQHAEATQIYQNVLQSKAFVLGTQCAITNVRLALSAWNAGLYPTALEAAEKALAPKVLDSPLQQTAHNMAALALANLNRHQEAIVHVEQSLVLARKSGSEKAIAATLTQLGSLKMQVGQLNEAMQFANEAIPLSHKAQFNSRTLQAEILMAWGRYDDALAAFQAASRAPAFGIPQLAARTQATFALGIARIYNEKRDGATALDWLEKTREGFAGDAKLETWAQATRLWAISLLGDRPDFERNLALFESQLAVLPEDTTTQRVGLHAQAEAAHVWQNFPAMLDLWERYLALKPAPINERRALYAIGEAQWMLDNPTRAHTAWEQAAATGIECFWSGLAKKRLAEFEQRALKPPA